MWNKIQGAWSRVQRFLQPTGVAAYRPLLRKINELEPRMQALDDEALAAITGDFRQRLERGATLDELLPEAYAVVREVSWRRLGMRHFDVQILGGIVLHQGAVAEMKTGEGKTLVATLPAYLNALAGKGVHIITVNDYLAARDAEWMGQIYRFLGLEVGVILEDMGRSEQVETQRRQEAYLADITYGTNHEMVFDYLRDNLATDPGEWVHRGQHFAIVDEVDFLLIDEVRTPLIISGPSREDVGVFTEVDRIVRRLRPGVDFKVEARTRTASLTEEGINRVEGALNQGNLDHPDNLEWFHAVYQSVLAHGVYRRDVDYIVRGGEVKLVDEFTGRVSEDKRLSDGLHQAIEAKERVKVRPEDRTFARMSYQNYFRLYGKLSGMTGTAATERTEFRGTYGMNVVVVPTNKPMIRTDYEDAVFASLEEKQEALVTEISHLRNEGRPVLVGTVSVEESEQVARRLKKRKIPCQVLNAKNHPKEAEIIAQAGRRGAVTISTNMAGRGTDILLGGNAEKLAEQRAKPGSEKYETWKKRYEKQCEEERQQVVEAGGLHVIGTSLHEAVRIDNQLRGRAGRQGDPGSSQFIICLEDHIFRRYGQNEIDALLERYEDMEKGAEIVDRTVLRMLEGMRKKVEIENQAERTETLKYDVIVNDQREKIYKWRTSLLTESQNPEGAARATREIIEDAIADLARVVLEKEDEPLRREDLEELEEAYSGLFQKEIELPRLDPAPNMEEELLDAVTTQALEHLHEREERYGAPLLREIERQILLQTIDELWIDHLSEIERLEDGLNLVGYGQLDPLVVFRKEVGLMFSRLLQDIRRRAISLWFAVTPAPQSSLSTRKNTGRRKRKR